MVKTDDREILLSVHCIAVTMWQRAAGYSCTINKIYFGKENLFILSTCLLVRQRGEKIHIKIFIVHHCCAACGMLVCVHGWMCSQ